MKEPTIEQKIDTAIELLKQAKKMHGNAPRKEVTRRIYRARLSIYSAEVQTIIEQS